jgi:GTP-binding protein
MLPIYSNSRLNYVSRVKTSICHCNQSLFSTFNCFHRFNCKYLSPLFPKKLFDRSIANIEISNFSLKALENSSKSTKNRVTFCNKEYKEIYCVRNNIDRIISANCKPKKRKVVESDIETIKNIIERGNTSTQVSSFDNARIYVKAGDGGDGCVSFRREKFVKFGGPDGGNGGNGGNIWAVANLSIGSLSHFRRNVHFYAGPGNGGLGSNRVGANGHDSIVYVPVGTIFRKRGSPEWSPPIFELNIPGERKLLVKGGRGGRGNTAFKTGRATALEIAEKGELGMGIWLDLELKVIADVGIIGVPSAGKSTLLHSLSSARVKIGNYPFTTLVPVLGVCKMDMIPVTLVDVPGLLEGAHLGKGLGQNFLKHCERCRVLIHVIDGTSMDPPYDFAAINLELELFSQAIANKPQVLVYSKMDLANASEYYELNNQYFNNCGIKSPIPISANTGQGLTDVIQEVYDLIITNPENSRNCVYGKKRENLQKKKLSIDEYHIELPIEGTKKRLFKITGVGIELFAEMTKFECFESVKRLQKVLEVAGVMNSLRKMGVLDGDSILIGKYEMQWES